MRTPRLSRRARIFLRLLPALLLGAGCAAATPLRIGLKLPPAALGESVSLQQRLTVERNGRVEQFDAALEVDEQNIQLIILLLNQRVLSVAFDGQRLETWRHPMVPAQLKGEDVLEDLQLTLWPAAAIRRALPDHWSLIESDGQRILSFDEQPIIRIDYSERARTTGKAALANLRYGYRITVESVANVP